MPLTAADHLQQLLRLLDQAFARGDVVAKEALLPKIMGDPFFAEKSKQICGTVLGIAAFCAPLFAAVRNVIDGALRRALVDGGLAHRLARAKADFPHSFYSELKALVRGAWHDSESLRRVLCTVDLDTPQGREAAAQTFAHHPYNDRKLDQVIGTILKDAARDKSLCEDVKQSALLNITRKWLTGRIRYADQGPAQFCSFCYQLARNHVLDAWERKANRPFGRHAVRQHAVGDLFDGDGFDGVVVSADDDELRRELYRAIELLPEPQRQVMFHYLEGWSCAESGNKLGLSAQRISQLRKYCIAKLRRMLNDSVLSDDEDQPEDEAE